MPNPGGSYSLPPGPPNQWYPGASSSGPPNQAYPGPPLPNQPNPANPGPPLSGPPNPAHLGPYAPVPGPGTPPPGAPQTPQPPRSNNKRMIVIIVVVAVALIATMAVVAWVRQQDRADPPPANSTSAQPAKPSSASPSPSASAAGSPSPSAPTSADPVPVPVPLPPGLYPFERVDLTAVESAMVGGLKKGDCLTNPPDDLRSGATVVDCSEPHTDQVAGFVDLSSGLSTFRSGAFELELIARCGGLYGTQPITNEFRDGAKLFYPEQSDWDAGARVALCWVPVQNKTWTGSAIDGTARLI